ncbi:MAG: CopG family ribbon-helix-helix protein [Halobacteriaceae archaeon]
MPTIEVSIPDQLEMQIEQMVDEEDFVSRQEAYEQLLQAGLSTYKAQETSEEPGTEFAEEMMGQSSEPFADEEEERF